MIARNPGTLAQNLILSSKLGLVSIPKADALVHNTDAAEVTFSRQEALTLLQSLGRDLGMTSLKAREDVFPDEGYDGDAALQFTDEAIRKSSEGLDVAWMQGNELVAAFVVENAAGPWSGIRRLADLLALQPKSKCSFYVVSVPSLKTELLAEMHRPIYRLLKKSMPEVVRILDWPRLQMEVVQLGERVRYLKPEFLDGISEVSQLPVAATLS